MKRISLFLLLFLLLKATVMYSQDGILKPTSRIVPVSPNASFIGNVWTDTY